MKLRGMPTRQIVHDEVDPYPRDASAEGDLIALAKARVATFAPDLRTGALRVVLGGTMSPAAIRAAVQAAAKNKD